MPAGPGEQARASWLSGEAPRAVSARAAALAAPGTPGPARGAAGRAGALGRRRDWPSPWSWRPRSLRVQANPILAAVVLPLVLVAYQRTLLAWQTLLGLPCGHPLHPDPPLHGRRRAAGGAGAVPAAHSRSCSSAGCSRSAPTRRCAGGGRASRRRSCRHRGILGSLAFNVSRVNGVERPGAQAGHVLPDLLPRHLLRGERCRARPEARPHAPAADAGGGTLLAVAVAGRVADRHEPLQRPAPRDPVPELRGLRRRTSSAAPASARSASAQHPIALGAALVMLIPLTVYLHRRDGRLRLAGVRRAPHARRARHRLAHGGAHADRRCWSRFLWIKREETAAPRCRC